MEGLFLDPKTAFGGTPFGLPFWAVIVEPSLAINPFDKFRQMFADPFEPEGFGFLYRKSMKGRVYPRDTSGT